MRFNGIQILICSLPVIKNEAAIEQCRRLIEAGLQWGDSADWTNEDFEDLGERIFAQTSVRLSVSTLKRIWGKVRYESSPTLGTLNALASFAGFGGWREFVQQQGEVTAAGAAAMPAQADAAGAEGGAVTAAAVSAGSGVAMPAAAGAAAPMVAAGMPKWPLHKRQLRMSWIVLATLVLVGLLSLFSSRSGRGTASRPGTNPPGLRFESRRVSEDLPNSVVFQYDATPLHPRKVMIQQSWDTARREEVAPNGTAYTSLYYYPGYFVAHLVVDGESRKTCEVFIPTKGWKGIIERKPLPIYLTATPGPMGISAVVLQEKTGSALFNDQWVAFTNVREFKEVPADHFMLRTRLRNTSSVEQCLCRKVKVTILGTYGAIIIPLADKGCISDIGLLTGDRWISGKDHDLSAFGCDFRYFQDLTCAVENRRLKIALNATSILDTDQGHSIGRIMGVRIEFEGAGEVRKVRLSGPGQDLDLLEPGSSAIRPGPIASVSADLSK